MATTSFGWLHLTDLHIGMRGQSTLLPSVEKDFLNDVDSLHAKCGPWDLIIFTGDLVQQGKPEEFNLLNSFLTRLWQRLQASGSSPYLLALPGNHDLTRPTNTSKLEVEALKEWCNRPDHQNEFWTSHNSRLRRVTNKAFANYTKWWDNHPFPRLDSHQNGLLPGDFSAVLSKGGVKLGFVGLNSTFIQLAGGDYQGYLAVGLEQFHSTCGGNGVDWLDRNHINVLLTHQPPDWLEPTSRNVLAGEIYRPAAFAVHMFGHMHDSHYLGSSVGGAAHRREWQGASLFGLEHFGEVSNRGERSHGYSAGRIEVNQQQATLRFWPRKAVTHQSGHLHLVPDYSFELNDDQGTKAEILSITLPITAVPQKDKTVHKPLAPRNIPPPPDSISVFIVTPNDMAQEGQLLHQRLSDIGKLSIAGCEIAILPSNVGSFADLSELRKTLGPSRLCMMVLLVWSELGHLSAARGDTNELGSLVESAYRLALEDRMSMVLCRCNRELSFRPGDPNWETKVLNFKGVDQFFALHGESSAENALDHTFQTATELILHVENDLKPLTVSALARSVQENKTALPEIAQSEPSNGIDGIAWLEDVLLPYLHRIVESHERLELRGIGGTSTLASIPLEDVYIALRGVRATEHERQQSRSLLQSELLSLIRMMPEGISPIEFAQLVEEAEIRALIANPVMPLLVERDRQDTEATRPAEVTMSLGEAFRTERWMVILGDPGSGKTTLLRWIARKLALAMLPDPNNKDLRVEVPAYQVNPAVSRDNEHKVDLGQARLPVLIRVSAFAEALMQARKNGQALPLIDFLGTHTWQGEPVKGEGGQLNSLIRTFLQQGRAVVLIDGMDEVTASSQRDEVVHAIETFIADWINGRGDNRRASYHASLGTLNIQGVPWESGGNQILITSRIAGYHASPIAGAISHMTVQPMQRRAVEHFCDAWTLAVYRQLFPEDEESAIKDATLEADGLKSAIFNPESPHLWELASNPLMITILALIYRQKQGQLPRMRSELYQTALEILIENWRFTDITTDEFIYVLSPLAAKIHRDSSTGLIREDEMREIITRELALYRGESPENPQPRFVREVRSFLRKARMDVGLLAERSTGLYGFLHLTFQEYLAGLYLVQDRHSAGQAIVDRLDDPRWREPILLALGHVSSNPAWGPAARGKLLRQILDADDPLGDLLPRGPLLVIRALPEMENVPDELVGELLDKLLRTYTISANDEALSALARQIDKAVDTVYNSGHRGQVVTNLVRVLTQVDPKNMDQCMACASLIRANGWQHPEFIGPLLRCQPYDDIKWSLPVTGILRKLVTPATSPLPDLNRAETEIEELRQVLVTVEDGTMERSLREEIIALTKRLNELGDM